VKNLDRAVHALTFLCAIAVLFSIRANQILLGASLAALLVSSVRIRWPRIAIPLGLFLLGTLVALAASPDPAHGWPQVRKIYVYTTLIVVYSALRSIPTLRNLVTAWTVGGAVVSALGVWQFIRKAGEARATGQDFYEYYVVERITGFMSHWMTFGGEQMMVLLMALSLIFFAPPTRRVWLWWLGAGLIAAGIALGLTRSIWLGTAAGVMYLLWYWKRWTLILVPIAAVVLLAVGPRAFQTRAVSIVKPKKETDSNEHRIITFRTGIVMIKAHPWLGLGPEIVNRDFMQYVPADIPRPLPVGWYGHLHNIYLHYAAERGIPTMLALVAMLLMGLYDWWRAARKATGDVQALLHGATAVTISIMIAGIFEHNLGDSEVLAMYLTIAAAGYVAWDTVSCDKPLSS
jgi:O-antigen ligase